MSQPIDTATSTRVLGASRLANADSKQTMAWLPPEALAIDLTDPAQRRFGDYELIERIGQGGMGVVYRARQHGLERDVAIKLLGAGPGASPAFVERFRREARSAARMQHPNIVEIFEFGHRDGLNYFTMRLIEGPNLADRLAADGRLPPRDAARLLRTLAEAVDYAHRLGVLHLDLKPANVLLDAAGVPMIADFGLARAVDAEHEGGEISGTPSYMAPEQARGEAATAATDLYGLGAILYECIAGRPPFAGGDAQAVLERVVAHPATPLRQVRADVPIDLEAICLKCLAKAPGERYANARTLADDLGRFLEHRAVTARRTAAWERLRLWARREPRMARMLAFDFAAGLAGGLVLALMYL
ncbi:MAG: serine/threonine-protein kinase, partial [Arenimonas sp.]